MGDGDPTAVGGARAARIESLVRRTVLAGWCCLVLSAVFLALSGRYDLSQGSRVDEWLWAGTLMLARLFGMASFAIGGVAIYNHRWTEGVLILLISVVLPIVALVVYGTI